MLLALGCAWSAPVAALAAVASEPPPVEVGDWTFVGNSAATVMFIKPEAPPAGSAWRRVLVRFEEAAPFDRRGFASMSSVELDEVDCAGQKTRVIRDTRYAERNMKGESRVDTVDAPAWKSEAKGSFGAGILKAVCGEVL
jgi:hypothetical protein